MAAVLRALLVLAALAATPLAAYAQNLPRVINLSSESTPGWTPSVALEREVLRTHAAYFAAIESGDFATAYAMIAPINRQTSAEVFAQQGQERRAADGALIDRTIVKLTWTKDPPNAPFPGIYAAIDVTSRHANIDRECGYLMWYQKPEGGPFMMMRIETTRMDNATAAQIEKDHDRAEVDRVWAAASSYCPNYPSAG